MSKCVSESGQVSAINTAEGRIAITQDWSYLTVVLAAGSSGTNKLLIGGANGMLIPAGLIVGPMLIAPKTLIRVTTTHTSAVNWGYQITTLPGIAMIDAVLSVAEFFKAVIKEKQEAEEQAKKDAEAAKAAPKVVAQVKKG